MRQRDYDVASRLADQLREAGGVAPDAILRLGIVGIIRALLAIASAVEGK